MKHIKDIEIFEKRAITREPMPIGDFLFDKFFYNQTQPRIKDTEPDGKKLKYYSVFIYFHYQTKNGTLGPDDFDLFKDFANYTKKFCKKEEGQWMPASGTFLTDNYPSFRFNFGDYYGRSSSFNDIIIELKLEPEKVEEIKNTPEYKEWLKSVKNEYDFYMAKKISKKYNL